MSDTLIESLLANVRTGKADAQDRLFEAVYGEMRLIANAFFRNERPDHTLSPTAVVHEAWLRLAGDASCAREDRRYFFACAAQAIRRVLVDHARGRNSLKRGGGRTRLPIDAEDLASSADPEDILALEEAVSRLEQQDEELGEVVRLRFYAGLSREQAAEVMGLSLRTFRRRWDLARGWLLQALRQEDRELIADA